MHVYWLRIYLPTYPPTYPPTTHPPTHPPTHQLPVYDEACASATESTPAVEEALRFYAEYGDEARLTALLERGIVNIEARDEHQYTALMCAAMHGHAECTQMLIKAGSDVTAKSGVRYEQCVGVGDEWELGVG